MFVCLCMCVSLCLSLCACVVKCVSSSFVHAYIFVSFGIIHKGLTEDAKHTSCDGRFDQSLFQLAQSTT